MGEGEETIELRFRIYDGTDIGQGAYALSMTFFFFFFLDKTVTPNSVNDVKLIHAGKILEDNKTLADSKITIGDLPGGVVTMHVVVQPPVAKKKTEKNEEQMQKMNACTCNIL
ncbi:membrane-anchored ubiquitin-fold protein 3 [Quercus suber]|uniref:membrane-anchored ubiquitin-fold protein 3 n=1 Tax=Quercus suber TaxID=58331 RepID=UPI0032DFD476